MPNFIDIFRQRGQISFTGMRNVAMSLLPTDKMKLDKLYNDLKRGTGILDDDDHLNMYLRSFGKMHKAKLDAAFNCIHNPSELFGSPVEIYDWGCGQGTATVCLLDFLKANRIAADIRSINLIEPSAAAVDRASKVISCYGSYTINTVVKEFDPLNTEDITPSAFLKIHLFSNILDVDAFDLAKFIHFFQQSFTGDNYFICVGPYYSNNKRVDEFIAATDPDTMFAVVNKDRGTWQNDWTISLRVFFKIFQRIETVEDIRKRIEESHKKQQFFAGYILDAVEEEYKSTDIEGETEGLYHSLSSFDVKSNIPLDNNTDCDSKLAVLANIISRGLPTKAPIYIEELFSEHFNISKRTEEGSSIRFSSNHAISKEDINNALHVIDPRFDIESYNGDMLESSFEKAFIERYLKGSGSEYLIQILEPQRPLSSIVSIPDRKFSKEQRVDFALEIPYGDSRTGFILELDGKQYHSNIFQRLRDERRDRMSLNGGWDTYRIDQIHNNDFIVNWEKEASASKFLTTLKNNYRKTLSGKWNENLQIVLAPLAIARIERMMVEAMMSSALDVNAEEWNIIVIERDVPCAAVAIEDLKDKYMHLCKLSNCPAELPKINLTVVSSKEFKDSPLHLQKKTVCDIPSSTYDLCIDISMLLRDNIDALPLAVSAKAFYLIRSSHYQKRERTICSADNIQYPALVTKDGTGSYKNIKEREDVLTYFLRDIFRKPSFRPGQLPILSHTLADKTTIGLLPTGGGKSLTYQLSCLLQPGVSIIVDPLVSLMVDQVRGLRDARIDACECVHSGMDAKEKAKKLNLLQNGAALMVLLSPERYMMENFRDSLITMTEKNHIYFSYGVIDEVHCVSEWGHDFRPSYLHLGRNMINYMKTRSGRPLSIIGLTATASFDVLADVERELTLGGNLTIDSETIVRPESDTRPELTYRIINVTSDFDELRDPAQSYVLRATSDWDLQGIVAETKKQVLFSLLNDVPLDIQSLNEINSSCVIRGYQPDIFYLSDSNNLYQNAGIIFCPHAHGTFGVQDNVWGTRSGISTALRSKEYLELGTFIGGDRPSGDMKLFNDNRQNLMVATKAFGMGIDKPNIRFTVNFNHPSSIESYVQEAGRAGRDRKNAISYILYEPTEFIHLTADKINDIRYYMGTENDPVWLERYVTKYVLVNDFPELCRHNNATEEQTNALLNIIRTHGFLENVDKNIDLWFHNNSFRGLYKEKVILSEMTDRILNVKPSYALEVQGRLREETGNNDVCLKVNRTRNSITIYSEEENRNRYGYIILDNLRPSYNYVEFDYNTCQYISQKLIDILATYEDHSAAALLRPIEGVDDITEGIYSAMAQADDDGYVFVTVSWENQVQQDPEDFERNIKTEISQIAQSKGWNDINEDRYGKLALNKIGDFEDLISKVAKCSGDTRWLRYHADEATYRRLRFLFCKKRDKDDTDKAIYRMCCIGLVEDVTIDYLSQTYELKIKNRTDEEFKQFMLNFFRKYYSLEQAQMRVDEIDKQKGRNYLDKCLGYLTGFVYENLEKKRFRAIEDMRIACEDSISERERTHNDTWLKEFIHLYFNSKYARMGYQVNGKDYSLTEDTDQQGRDGYDVVRKYINIISNDGSGSEIDNVKHLYGATLLCLRAHPDNAALQLLLTYCITFLGTGTNETLKSNALNGYIDGFMALYDKDNEEVWDNLAHFNDCLAAKVHQDDTYIKENIIEKGEDAVMLFIHGNKLDKITNRFLDDNVNTDNKTKSNDSDETI